MTHTLSARPVIFILPLLIILALSSAQAGAHPNIDFDDRFYQDLFHEHGSVMLLIEPESGAILHANHAAAAFYGYTLEELESMAIQQINTLTPEETAQERMAASREERNYFVFRHRLASGDIRTVEVHSYPVRHQNQPLLFSMVTDITDKMALEQELQERQQSTLILTALAALGLLISTLTLLRLNRQRKKAMHALSQKQVFQEIIADVSSKLIEASADEVDEIIHEAVEACAKSTGVDRGCLVCFSNDRDIRIVEYEWLKEGVPSLMEQTENMPVDRLPWVYRQALEDRMIQVNDVSKLPPEAERDRQTLTEQQVKSLLMLPITVNQQVIAAWGFEDVRRKRHWEEKPLAMLQIMTKVFENAYERRFAEKRLQEWQRLTQYIIEHSPNAIAVHDKDLYYLYVSRNYLEQYQVKETDIIGKHHYEVFPDLPEKWRKVHQRVLAGAVESAEDDPYYRSDGTVDYTRWEARPWYEADGTIGGLIIYTEVINERKKREQALQESEERFRLLVETAPDGIFVYADRKLAFANQSAARLVGAENLEAIIDMPVMRWLRPDYRSEVEERYRLLLEEKLPVPAMEQVYVRPDGTEVDVEVSAVPIRYNGKDGALVYVRDITKRKRAERERMEELQQQRQQQKLEAIGTLASGVAHEINNPVTGIMNYAQLILDGADQSCPGFEYAHEIINESQRISDIVRDLLHFSRHEKQTHSRADIGDIVNRTLSLLRAQMRKDQIEIQLNLPEDLPPLKCRSQQIQQVLMNLLINARDALNEKYPGYHEDKVIYISGYLYTEAARRWIRLTVEDHGNGIPQNIQDRLFDPFFTTKPKELGTGLGLPISYGIMKEHHGKLSFETEEGEFTRFHLTLPVDNGWDLEK